MKGILEPAGTDRSYNRVTRISWAVKKPSGKYVTSGGWKGRGTAFPLKAVRYYDHYKNLAEDTAKECGGTLVKITIIIEEL